MAPGLTCVCGDTGMQAMCELPQGGGIEVVAYVAFALIGAILLCSNGWCNGDVSDEDEPPRERRSALRALCTYIQTTLPGH
jgi:hypothetical protein